MNTNIYIFTHIGIRIHKHISVIKPCVSNCKNYGIIVGVGKIQNVGRGC